MNLDSFKELVANHNSDFVDASIPFRWIGRGWGYKIPQEEFDRAEDDEVVYISEAQMEYMYMICGTGEDVSGVAWTKKDFMDLCEGDETAAGLLFHAVDYQSPHEFLLEVWLNKEEESL